MPLLEENGENTWVFDSLAKKSLVTKLFATMTGSVVTSGQQSSKRARTGDKENEKPKRKAKAKAKTKPGAEIVSLQLPEESDIKATVVSCKVGVRAKLWVDDLLNCCSHIIDHVSTLCAAAAKSNLQELKSKMIRQGLMFCFNGSIRLTTARGSKTYRKWSVLRPVLKEWAMWQLSQV